MDIPSSERIGFVDLARTASFLGLNYHTVKNWTYGGKVPPDNWPAPRKLAGKTGYLLDELKQYLGGLPLLRPELLSDSLPVPAAVPVNVAKAPGTRGRPRNEEAVAANAAGISVKELRRRQAEMEG